MVELLARELLTEWLDFEKTTLKAIFKREQSREKVGKRK
jgi:hypothetical protein